MLFYLSYVTSVTPARFPLCVWRRCFVASISNIVKRHVTSSTIDVRRRSTSRCWRVVNTMHGIRHPRGSNAPSKEITRSAPRPRRRTHASYSPCIRRGFFVHKCWKERSSRFDTNQTVMATWKFRSIISRKSCKGRHSRFSTVLKEIPASLSPPMDILFFPFHFYSRQFFPWSSCVSRTKEKRWSKRRSSKRSSRLSLAAWIYFHRVYISRRFRSACVVFRDFCALGDFQAKKIR